MNKARMKLILASAIMVALSGVVSSSWIFSSFTGLSSSSQSNITGNMLHRFCQRRTSPRLPGRDTPQMESRASITFPLPNRLSIAEHIISKKSASPRDLSDYVQFIAELVTDFMIRERKIPRNLIEHIPKGYRYCLRHDDYTFGALRYLKEQIASYTTARYPCIVIEEFGDVKRKGNPIRITMTSKKNFLQGKTKL